MSLRPYQREALERLRKGLEDGSVTIPPALPPGAGKTRNGFAKSLALPVFRPVIVPDKKKKAASKSRQRQRARLRKLHPEGDH